MIRSGCALLATLVLSALLTACSSLEFINQLSEVPENKPVTISYGESPRQQIDVYPVPDSAQGSASIGQGSGLIASARAAPAAGRPLVVFFYGGSWNSGSRSDYRFLARAFNDLGYVVAIPDYRLTPEVLYPEFLRDSAAAVSMLIKRASEFGADPNRVVLVGHSAGAYNAAMLAMDPRWMPAADRKKIRGLIGLALPADFLPIRIPSVQQTFNWPDTPRDTQPIEHVSKDNPPTLLITAASDRLVNPETNSFALAKRMQEQGVPVQVEIFNGAGIGHASLVATLSSAFSFLAPTLDRMRLFIDQVTQ
jgi:acetyl esterase/lipase